MQFISPPTPAEALYDALFEWQPPVTLWETSESLAALMAADAPALNTRHPFETKKILEAWVMGKTLTLAYHDEDSLVRVAHNPAMDGQIYHQKHLQSVEVTQALYPGRRRNMLRSRAILPGSPIAHHERKAYMLYRDAFFRKAYEQIEARIEHKFNLYKSLDYLILHVDLFDPEQPRFSAFALQDFNRECGSDLAAHLQARFYTHWHHKINNLFLLDEKPLGGITRFSPLFLTQSSYDHLSLA